MRVYSRQGGEDALLPGGVDGGPEVGHDAAGDSVSCARRSSVLAMEWPSAGASRPRRRKKACLSFEMSHVSVTLVLPSSSSSS